MKSLKKFLKYYLPKGMLKKIKVLRIKFSYIKNSTKPIRGKVGVGDVYCPCCNNYFSNFEDFKYNKEYNNQNLYENNPSRVVCPYCKSFPRHRIVCDYLDKNRLLTPSTNILVFAPPYGYELWLKRNGLHYISADLYDRTADMKVDIQYIPFHDNEFDFISCDHVLEHVPDYTMALKELLRVVKIGGCVEITVPLFPDNEATYEDNTISTPAERVIAFGQYDHLRVFGMDFYTKLQDIGFDVTIYNGDTCDKKIAPLIAPAAYDYNKIFICKKILM